MYDLIFQSLCACLRLHTGFRPNYFLQKFTFVVWFFIHFAVCLSTLIWWLDSIGDTETRSLSTFPLSGSEVVFIAALIVFEVNLTLNHDEIESPIRRNGRRVNELIPQFACWAPFGLIGLRQGLAAPDIATVMKEAYFTVLELSVLILFLIFGDVVMNLKSAHESILTLTMNIEVEQREIRCLEWALRDSIRRTNGIFSWT